MNEGYLFEQVLLDRIKSMGIFEEIHYETDLRKRWGWHMSSIDYLMVYQNKIIVVIQAKWRRTRRRENAAVQNFIRSIEYVKRCYQSYKLIGLWVSRMVPFEDNQCNLQSYNVYCVSNDNDMANLANSMQQKLNAMLTSEHTA